MSESYIEQLQQRLRESEARERQLRDAITSALEDVRLNGALDVDTLSAALAQPQPTEAPHHDDVIAEIVRSLRSYDLPWSEIDVDDRNKMTADWRAMLKGALAQPQGEQKEPKQYGCPVCKQYWCECRAQVRY